MIKSLVGKVYLSVGVGAIVFLGLAVYADAEALRSSFRAFDTRYIGLALGLALANYFIRWARWRVYLRRLDVRVSPLPDLGIFFSGLVMSVTPGKAGELLKAWLVHQHTGVPVRRTAPAVVAERLTDFIALLFLSSVGIFTYHDSAGLLVVGAAGTVVVLAIVIWPGALTFVVRALRPLPVVGRLADPLGEALEAVRTLVSPRILLSGTALGIVAWLAECLGFYLVLKGFGAGVDAISATFIYSFATIFGALTLLPGGIGTTEGSMSGLLVLRGVPLADAVAATFVIRVCTLWFAVALGALVLISTRNRLPTFDPATDAGVNRSTSSDPDVIS